MFTTEQMQTMIDNDGVVVDNDGNKVGKIGEVFLDDESGRPEWVTTKAGMFGGAGTFVPLSGAEAGDNEVRVAYDKATIKDAPSMDSEDGHLSPEQESELYRHYRLDRDGSDRGRNDGGADGNTRDHDRNRDHHDGGADGNTSDHDHHDSGADGNTRDRDRDRDRHDSGADGGETMVRSEERLDVGTERVQTGKARLRKHVVTENVTKTVPVEREEVRLERVPVDENDTVDDGDLGDAEAAVTLTEERVTVDKETVPVEKVKLGTETVTEDQEVSEEVRKEQIDSDVDDPENTTRNR